MVDRIGQRGDDLDRLLVGRLALAEPVLEGDPRHEVGDDETSAVLNPDVVNGDDSRVFEPGQPSRFQEENLPVLRSRGPERDLDRDLPLEQVVPADMDPPTRPDPTRGGPDNDRTPWASSVRPIRATPCRRAGAEVAGTRSGLPTPARSSSSEKGPRLRPGEPDWAGRRLRGSARSSSAGNAERPLVPGGRAAGERHTLRPPCFRFLVRHGHRRSLEEGRCSSRVNERN